MSVKLEDAKPVDYDAFNIPVEDEEELAIGPSMGQSKIWAIKVDVPSRQLMSDSQLPV